VTSDSGSRLGASTRRRNGVDTDGIVALFYEAILAPDLWAESVRQLGAAFGHAVTSITCFRNGKGESLTGASDPAFFRLYNDHYGALDPHAARVPRNAPPGMLGLAEEVVPLSELERTAYYNEFMKPMGTYYGIGGVLRTDANGLEAISLFRAKSQGPFSTGEQRLLAQLGSHFRRARTVWDRIESLAQRSESLKGVLDTMRCALATCDERGRVTFANAAAAEDLKRGRVLGIAPGGFLSLRAGAAQDRLRTASRHAALGKAGCVAVPRPWPLSPLVVNLAPRVNQGLVRQVVVAWEADTRSEFGDVEPEALRTALGITPAELRVALLVTNGCDTKMIGERLNVEPNTVRVHLKRIYSKTGATGRADLARLVLGVTSSLTLLRAKP